jgi:hypothetical protein
LASIANLNEWVYMAGMSQLLVTGRDFGSGKFTERDAGFDGHPHER